MTEITDNSHTPKSESYVDYELLNYDSVKIIFSRHNEFL